MFLNSNYAMKHAYYYILSCDIKITQSINVFDFDDVGL